MSAHGLILDLDLSAYERDDAVAFVRAAIVRVPVAVRAEASRSDAEDALAQAGILEEIVALVTLDDIEHGLPDPGGHLLAVARLNEDRGLHESIVAGDVLAVEDSERGLDAAAAAGVRCAAVGSLDGRGKSLERFDPGTVEGLLG